MSDVAQRPLWDLVGAHRDEIKAIVARHHGRSVAIFGSVARGKVDVGTSESLRERLRDEALAEAVPL
jgi:predicted nucleotidyltransferase